MCFLYSSTNLFRKFLILRRIQRDIVLKVHFYLCNNCKYLVKHEVLYSFWKRLQISKIVFNQSSVSQRTAMTKLVVTFLKFVKAPDIFHCVTHLKYPKKRTYLHLN